MEPPLYEGTPSPYGDAGWISRLGFRWVQPLVDKGLKKSVRNSDLYHPLREDSSSHCVISLSREWQKEVSKQQYGGAPSLWCAVCRTVAPFYLPIGFLILLQRVAKIAQPVLFSYLLAYFSVNGGGIREQEAWCLAGGIALCTLVEAVLWPTVAYLCQRTALKARSAIASLLYRKLLVLSRGALHSYSRGQVMELLAEDLWRMSGMVWYGHEVWLSPMSTILVVYITYQYIGAAALLGTAVAIGMVPISGIMGRKMNNFRLKRRKETERRVGVMTELLSSMRLVKLLCWEYPLTDRVTSIRRSELKYMWKRTFLGCVALELNRFGSRLVQVVTFSASVISGHVMTASAIFPVMSLFSMLQTDLVAHAHMGYNIWLRSQVSILKLQNFLLAEELSPKCDDEDSQVGDWNAEGLSIIRLQNVSTKWDQSQTKLAISNTSVSLEDGQLILLTGPVGSGKSGLLLSILQELPVVSGQLTARGRLSYAAQRPWVFPSTIRQNILGGLTMDTHRYEKVLYASALNEDLNALPNGDLTWVGDSGVTLSGGQKSRVNLARALYRDAEVYLLDDPLSAVDTKVSRQIFDKCISGFLQDKLRILVTQQQYYLKHADLIVIMKDGGIEFQGTYEELLNCGIDLASRDLSSRSTDDEQWSREDTCDGIKGKTHELKEVPRHFHAWEAPDKLSRISLGVVLKYFQNGAHWLSLTSVLLVYIMVQIIHNMLDWCIAEWSSAAEKDKKEDSAFSSSQRMWLHLILSVSVVTLGIGRRVFFQRICHNAASSLHDQMVAALMRCPISLFDQSSIGWLMSHFSSAIQSLDHNINSIGPRMLQTVLRVAGSVAVVGWYTPMALLPACPLVAFLVYVHQRFSSTDQQLLSIDAKRHISYMDCVSSTFLGMDTLRAQHMQARCIRDCDLHVDLVGSSWMTRNALNDWMTATVNGVGALFVAATLFGCMATGKDLGAAQVGLVILNAIPLIGQLSGLMETWSSTQSVFFEASRVFDITELPHEAPLIKCPRPSQDWPQEGAICFRDISFRYKEGIPPAINNVTFSIRPGEKVGIIGRTGAGKTSLVQVLCRLGEYEGQIVVDDVDIGKLGLQDLRSRIAVIPQDPALFNSSIRHNLDPAGQHTDNSLWEALDQVDLGEVVGRLDGGLDCHLADGGSNFSVGQRQLLCLARTILRRSTILILDEATSSVDHRTEELILDVVRDKFHKTTVLTIAHRLHTVLGADRIMVMDEGAVKEFDQPSELLQNPKSHLRKLLEQTGPEQQRHLLAKVRLQPHKPKSQPGLL